MKKYSMKNVAITYIHFILGVLQIIQRHFSVVSEELQAVFCV
jgi:hypothetical protein